MSCAAKRRGPGDGDQPGPKQPRIQGKTWGTRLDDILALFFRFAAFKKDNDCKISAERKGQAQLLNCTYLALTTALLGRHENPERSLEHNVLQSSSVPVVAIRLEFPYISRMLFRVRNSRGRPINAPAAFIPRCRPIVVAEPPRWPWLGARAEA